MNALDETGIGCCGMTEGFRDVEDGKVSMFRLEDCCEDTWVLMALSGLAPAKSGLFLKSRD